MTEVRESHKLWIGYNIQPFSYWLIYQKIGSFPTIPVRDDSEDRSMAANSWALELGTLWL